MKRVAGFLAVVLALATAGCGTTRYVPRGEWMLAGNAVEVDRSVPRRERIGAADVEKFIRQTPARRLLGTDLPVAFFSAQDTARNRLFQRAMRSLGSPPVIFDSTMTVRSADNIRSYLRSRGYLDSRLEYSIRKRRHRVWVTYSITQGEPYRIGTLDHDFRDRVLSSVVGAIMPATLLRTGDVYDVNTLNAERARISDHLKNNGYYNFSIGNISYDVRPRDDEKRMDVTMVIRQYLAGYDADGSARWENNMVYSIREIVVNQDYDPERAIGEPGYAASLDTLHYNGLDILYDGHPKLRRQILRRAVNVSPGDYYSARQTQQVYSNIMRLGVYRNVSITTSDITDSTTASAVTFLPPDEGEAGGGGVTREGFLRQTINCTPALRQSYRVSGEGSLASNFYALGATLGYQNKNLLRGAELFSADLTGRYEYPRKGGQNSYELGAGTSILFPRFISPVVLDPRGRRVNPRTGVELAVNYQHRKDYHRTLSGARFGYSWSNTHYSSFAVRPADINLVKVGYIRQGFLDSLENVYLRESYRSQLVAGVSATFTYNTQLRQGAVERNSVAFTANLETMGNMFRGISALFSRRHVNAADGRTYYNIFGIRFAQYVRLDASFSQRIVLGGRTSLAYRVMGGGGHSYGNSSSIPIDRMFFSGGSNSMRGWIARSLGPGTTPSPASDKYPSQVGNLRLEANVEFRFPVWDFFHGAVFVDAGNVWITGRNNNYADGARIDADAMFRFDRFYRQLGLNTGAGLRMDFSRFIFRVDWGVRLHDPGNAVGRRWIHGFRYRDTALNFGVGYPF